MSTVSVEVVCPDGAVFKVYDGVTGKYVSSGSFSSGAGSVTLTMCVRESDGATVSPMTGRFNTIVVVPPGDPQSNFEDGFILGWGVLAAMAAAWGIMFMRRAM